LLILTSSAPDRIVRTIRSRCHELLVPPRSKSELAQELINEYHVLSSRAQVAAGFCKGAHAGADKAPEEFMARRDLVLDRYILSRPEYDFIKTLTENRESARELLDIVLTFFRDVALVREGAGDEALIHADRADAVRQVAAGLTGADVQRIIAGVVSAIKGMQENMNIRLSLILLREMM
jgi:DNA polymerase-3 subunit delta'